MNFVVVLTQDHLIWKLTKNISKGQPQVEKCNTIQCNNGNIAQDDGQAANMLGKHYQNVSKLNFTRKDRSIKIRASNVMYECRSSSQDGTSIFKKDFIIKDIETAISETNINKFPGPDGIHGQMISNLGQRGDRDSLTLSMNPGGRDNFPVIEGQLLLFQ
ncbi:RNase H domain-containing protein [Nephila pilipes]|uniref:RNase H domain-containing protein n=1 Tax=Nephila pilipes TaxID=299642 RepID=A0A8X6QPF7_NEPPI|nr:RNase H domain-containing protein [Nephila pilipes]